MKKSRYIIILSFVSLFFLSIILPGNLFPSDVINNFPSYSINTWEKPKNSLLADPVFQFEPWRKYAKENISKGIFPFWNNLNGSGSPFFANPQTAVLYPLNFLYYLLPFKISSYLIPLLKLYIFGFFTYLYLRAINSSRLTAMLGTIAATFSGFPIVWLLWPHTNVFILFPLILHATEKIYKGSSYIHRWYIVLTISYFAAILGGHPETLFLIGIFHALYVLLRFWNKKRKIIPVFISIICGILLGSIQIIPFLEYLFNSYAYQTRTLTDVSFLPFQSIILNLIPFLSGAPHSDYYRPVTTSTNFQEAIGGYVGTGIILFVFWQIFSSKKDTLVKIWIFIIGFSFVMAYNIIHKALISYIPVINQNANSRFIAFFGFGMAVLFTLFLNNIGKIRINTVIFNKILYLALPIITILIVFLNYFILDLLHIQSSKIQNFIVFLQYHLIFITITTIVFFILLIKAINTKQKRNFYLCSLAIPLLLQNLFLLWNYNPVTSQDNYYPENTITKKLNRLPPGKILEIGNLMLPSNINLMYHFASVDNNDAVQIFGYKESFDKAFPIKNQWNNVDEVDLNNLKKFGIKYVLSDYNLNYHKQIIEGKYDRIHPPLTSSNPFIIHFRALENNVKQIRLLTANFNRVNTCTIQITIYDIKMIENLARNTYRCKDIRDYSYFTFNIPDNHLVKGTEYTVKIESPNGTMSNSIALWGSSDGDPFAQFYYGNNDTKNKYRQLFYDTNVFIWEIPDFSEIETKAKYTLLSWDPQKISIVTDNLQTEKLEIKNTYYPGWSVYIDGKQSELINTNPFMAVSVPEGKHFVEFKYLPYSFYIGGSISSFTFFILLIYLIRKEKKELWWQFFNRRWLSWANLVSKRITWPYHVFFLSISFITSVLIFITVIRLLAIPFSMPFTTGINWLTVNHYPKQQDYFYFLFGFIFVTIFTYIFWLILIWIKRRKYL